jgi:hypothetical protein
VFKRWTVTRAAERGVADAHAAAVNERLLLDKGQAEPGARGAGIRAAYEPPRDTLPLVDRDAGAVVVDGQASAAPLPSSRPGRPGRVQAA